MAQTKSTGARAGRTTGRGVRPAPAPAAPLPLCSVPFCPLCMAVTAVGEVKPEFVEHLVAAGREFLLALRGMIDARLEGLDAPAKLERVTIQ
jgi:hypothetical protein